MHLVGLKNFLLSKIKEQFPEDFFFYYLFYLKFQRPSGGWMRLNSFDLSYATEFFCDLLGL